jgi:hypothetical protein
LIRFSKKNKAQISSQVFVYILSAVVIGLLLFIGAKAIQTIIELVINRNINEMKSDFQTEVAKAADQHSSVKRFDFNVPRWYDELCFVDAMEEDEKFHFDNSKINNSFIKDSVQSGVKENVFFMKRGIIKDKFIADKLDVEEDCLCLKNEGKLVVWLTGTGKKALLNIRN